MGYHSGVLGTSGKFRQKSNTTQLFVHVALRHYYTKITPYYFPLS
jgi:hypothetical protein